MAKGKRTRAVVRRGEHDAFIVALGDQLRDIIDPRQIMAIACEHLGKHLGVNRAFYAEFEQDRIVIHNDYCRDLPSSAGTHRLEVFGPTLAERARRGEDIVIPDVDAEPDIPDRKAYQAGGVGAGIAVPLVKGGHLEAVLTAQQREARAWAEDEVALVRDVAERTWAAVARAKMETALRASEERLRLALDASGIGTFLWQGDEEPTEASEQFLALVDLDPEARASLFASLRTRIHPGDLVRFDESNTRLRDPSGSGAFRHEFRIVRRDGEVRWLVFTGQVSFAGVPPRAVRSVGTVADITDRKRAEAVLAAAAKRDAFRVALADALRALASPAEVRRAASRVLNRHLGADRAFYAEIEPDDLHAVVDEEDTSGASTVVGRHAIGPYGEPVLHELRQGHALVVNDVASDARIAPDASAAFAEREVAACIAIPLVKAGRFAAALVVSQSTRRTWAPEEVELVEEAAERIWAAVERANAEQGLREADRRKDEFLAILAHELRNPLAPLRNALEVMRLAPRDLDVVEQARAMMSRQLSQMVRLIDDLMDVSRISRGKVELRRERVELAPIVSQAVETSRPLIDANRQRLSIEMPTKSIFIDADPTRLAQVFANLLNNAAKYTNPAGSITFAVRCSADHVVVSVRDDGLGIPAEMLPRVFDMFLQVDRSLEKAQGGLGVGLSLVKGLVELHGGNVEAHSEGPGRGSEFVVRMPLARPLARKAGLSAARDKAGANVRRRILIVDDNRDAATSLATVLTAMTYETRTAFDGLEAMEVSSVFRPHVVLLDIGMPRLNGYEACRRMRQEPWGRKAMMVALTGWGRDEDQQRSRQAGFDFHLVKPVDPSRLFRLLAAFPRASAPPPDT